MQTPPRTTMPHQRQQRHNRALFTSQPSISIERISIRNRILVVSSYRDSCNSAMFHSLSAVEVFLCNSVSCSFDAECYGLSGVLGCLLLWDMG